METPQQQTNLNFGQALELLKQGLSLQRAGWNGKGMFLFLVPGSTLGTGTRTLFTLPKSLNPSPRHE